MVHVLILSLGTTRLVLHRNLRGRWEIRVDQFIWGKIKEGAIFAVDFEIFTHGWCYMFSASHKKLGSKSSTEVNRAWVDTSLVQCSIMEVKTKIRHCFIIALDSICSFFLYLLQWLIFSTLLFWHHFAFWKCAVWKSNAEPQYNAG